jgi:acid phosphatase
MRHCLLLAALFLSACASAPESQRQAAAVDTQSASAEGKPSSAASYPGEADLLNSVLYHQSAAEFEFLCQQSFAAALKQIDLALAQKDWTAAEEQIGQDLSRLSKSAVIVDVDETMLDNSPYQARALRDRVEFTPETWGAWVREEAAREMPGAIAFTQALEARGIRVIYLSNRDLSEVQATKNNMVRLKFANAEDDSAYLFRNGKDPKHTKGVRRAQAAAEYRILMLVGDNLGDFTERYRSSHSERKKVIADALQQGWLGSRWVIIPNTMYGSWEDVLYGYDRAKPRDQKRALKWQALDFIGTPPPHDD